MRHLRRQMKAFLDDELPEMRKLVYPNQIILDTATRIAARKENVSVVVTCESSGYTNEPIRLGVKVIGGADQPTGQVTLYDEGRAVPNATRDLVEGAVTWALTYRMPGQHSFNARYSGDSIYYDQPTSNTVLLGLNEHRVP